MSKASQPREHRGFTLVELLVIIGIVVVLIALLLPALNKARSAANTIICASNLRSFGQLYALYQNSHSGWLPPVCNPPNSSTPSSPFWYEEIMTVMGRQASDYPPTGRLEFGIWRCPENAVATRPESTKDGEEYNSYVINALGTGVTALPENRYMGSKVVWMRWPSELYAMWDGASYHVIASSNDGVNSIPVPFALSGIESTSYRHNLGVNMLYADGHVAWLLGPLQYRGTGSAQANSAAGFTNGRPWYCQ